MAAFAPVIVIATLRWPTSSAAMIGGLLTGFVVSLAWLMAGLDADINSVLPAFGATLLANKLIRNFGGHSS